MLERALKEFGVREPEIRIYLLLIEEGSLGAGRIARRMNIPRASLYGFLDRLVTKGLLTQSIGPNGIKQFNAEPPAKLLILMDQRLDSLKSQREQLRKSTIHMEHAPRRRTKPAFQLYEGQEAMQHILKDSLLYHDISSESYWPIHVMMKTLTAEQIAYFNKKRIQNNFWLRSIWPSSDKPDLCRYPFLGVGKAFKREVRIAPKSISSSMGYWIYGSRVSFVSSYKEAIGFTIESPELAETLRTGFEFMWNASTPFKMNAKEKKATDGFLRSIGIMSSL